MDGQLADVAAGKKYRADDKGISAERETFAIQRKNGAIMQRIQKFVSELRQNHLFDQLMAEFPAAAMGKNNLACNS